MKAKKNLVFVCYEGNNHIIASESGPIDELQVLRSEKDAMEWVKQRVKSGVEDGFLLDEEYELSDRNLKREIKKGCVSITMFWGHQENWKESYDIVVTQREVA